MGVAYSVYSFLNTSLPLYNLSSINGGAVVLRDTDSMTGSELTEYLGKPGNPEAKYFLAFQLGKTLKDVKTSVRSHKRSLTM